MAKPWWPLLTMLMAVSNGFQAALMAPTEILAEQHLTTLRALLRPLDLEVALLTSTVKGRSRQQLLESIAQGRCRCSSARTLCSMTRYSSIVSA